MGKILALFCFMTSLGLQAKALTSKDVASFTLENKIKVVEAYREFFREYKTELSASYQSEFFKYLSLISEANASGGFNCFYAGWPSKTVGGKCTNPARTNTAYVSEATGASCSSSQLMCNPILFGRPGICVNTSNQALRNSAYTQCETRFASQNRTLTSVAASLNDMDLPALTEEMFILANRICRVGFQQRSRMCINLKEKLIELESIASGRDVEEVPVRQPVVARPQRGRPESMRNPVNAVAPAPVRPEVQAARSVARIGEVVDSSGNPDCPQSPELNPQTFLENLNENPLTFLGKGQFAGTRDGESCLYENEFYYVINVNCRTREAPAFKIHVISKTGGTLYISLENSQEVDDRTKISQTSRDQYDRTWLVNYRDTPPPTQPFTMNTARSYLESNATRGVCSIGGLMVSSPETNCSGASVSPDWSRAASQFWRNPGSDWYGLVRDMTRRAASGR